MKRQEGFWSAWDERVSALRNVPPVLKIVWWSSPTVVALGLVSRALVSLLPLGLLAITKLIVDYIVRAVTTQQMVAPRFWWLVAELLLQEKPVAGIGLERVPGTAAA